MTAPFVVPSNIPWESVKGKPLEECTYWLLEAIGAKNIDWRVGGTGGGAADGGRDLECTFHIPEPSGDIASQRWWVEVKGRVSSVSPSDIKESVLTVAGKPEVDVHLIVTNQQLTNPTKDWIAHWKREHRRPDIRFWERHDLERLVTKNPVVAVRLFPQALTPTGKREAMTARFWEYVIFADEPTLQALWKSRKTLEWDSRALFAALVSEVVNGDLAKRPWACIIPPEDLAQIYVTAMLNSFYLLFRADAAGVSFGPIVKALAHLLIHLIARHEPEVVATLTEHFTKFSEDLSGLPSKVRQMITDPVIRMALHQVGNACLSDCQRVMGDNRGFLEESEAKRFWQCFSMPFVREQEDEGEAKDEYLYIESHDGICNAQAPLKATQGCPVLHYDRAGSTLAAVRPVILFRSGLSPLKSDKSARQKR